MLSETENYCIFNNAQGPSFANEVGRETESIVNEQKFYL